MTHMLDTAHMLDATHMFDATLALNAAHATATKVLRDGGIETPALDARILLRSATGLSLEALIAKGREPVGAEQARRFSDYVNRRLAGEPVSRIRGRREFYGRTFRIDRHTLDPRPDTETLIEATLDAAAQAQRGGRPLRLLDLGTGSGCILITLLAELPNALGLGVDISAGALDCARENAAVLGVAGRARFVAVDWFEGLSGRFDLIVSNPPYISAAELASLPRDVAEHDPRAALDGGRDGLGAYRRIAARAAAFLDNGGRILVEIGPTQGPAVAELFRAYGLVVEDDAVKDLAGRPRCIRAGRPVLGRGGRALGAKNKLGQRGCSG